MPRASSSMSRESPSQPGNARCALPGSRCETSLWGSPFRVAPGTLSTTRRTRSSRSAPMRAARSCCCLTASSTATAKPAMAGVSRVPERMSRSCPPPWSWGVTSSSRRTTRAPTPLGPPSLCAVNVSASMPLAAKSTGTWPTACTASVCTGMPWTCAIRAVSTTGWTVPTSLLAHITDTSATESGSRSIEARSASRSRRPRSSTGSSSTSAPSCSASQCTASRTAWCSTAVVRTRVRRGSSCLRAQKIPLSARLSDSVPPEVNTTSPGRQLSARAMVSRDSSTTRRAARPDACSADALPACCSCSVIAATASGCIGVDAAWSR